MNKEVIVALRGGVATVVKQPEGVNVHIRDYDIDLSHYNYCNSVDVQTDEQDDNFIFACDCCS